MARPKEFNQDAVLEKAMQVFWARGYESTSLDELLKAMGIGRQSLYDTFGDKHALYLRALERYKDTQGGALQTCLEQAASPLEALRQLFLSLAEEPPAARRRGCMMVNATVEMLPRDEKTAELVAANQRFMETAFRRALQRSRQLGELPEDADIPGLARYLVATFQGLRVAAKAEMGPEALRDVARHALRGLAPATS
jgi:TetR/AcrR family transcriptional repressor of nem operon